MSNILVLFMGLMVGPLMCFCGAKMMLERGGPWSTQDIVLRTFTGLFIFVIGLIIMISGVVRFTA